MAKSYKKAIEEMCKHCIYDKNAAGTWRQQVDACTSPKCPLYNFRPISREKPLQNQEKLHVL
jgi:hypothetical protein